LPAGPRAEAVVEQVRRRLADDLDAPAALSAVDRWARDALVRGGHDAAAPQLMRALVDALLGVELLPPG